MIFSLNPCCTLQSSRPDRHGLTESLTDIPMRLLTLLLLALLPAAGFAQDAVLSAITGVLTRTNSVSIFLSNGSLLNSNTGPNGALFAPSFSSDFTGAGMEVLIDLPSPTNASIEFGLATHYVRGIRSAEGIPSLAIAYRTLPRVGVYISNTGGAWQPYIGGNFGVATLTNASGQTDSSRFNVTGSTYTYGVLGGLAFDFGHFAIRGARLPISIYGEVSYQGARFGSVQYERTTGEAEVPPEWPLELNLNSLILEAGVQFQVAPRDNRSLEGTWLLAEVDEVALPALQSLQLVEGSGGTADNPPRFERRQIVGGVLTLHQTNARHRTGEYELNIVERTTIETGKEPTTIPPPGTNTVIPSYRGLYDMDAGVLRLCRPQEVPPGERCDPSHAGRSVYSRAYRSGENLVVLHPVTGRVLTFSRSPD